MLDKTKKYWIDVHGKAKYNEHVMVCPWQIPWKRIPSSSSRTHGSILGVILQLSGNLENAIIVISILQLGGLLYKVLYTDMWNLHSL